MSAGEGVASDFLAAFDAFKKKRVARTLRNAQIGTDGREQIRGTYVVDRDEVPLFRETLEFAEVRLNHG